MRMFLTVADSMVGLIGVVDGLGSESKGACVSFIELEERKRENKCT